MSELQDQATTSAIAATENKREAERLRAMLEEKTAQLVRVTIERDEARRELAQVQGSERAVRRLVLHAGFAGETYLAIREVREALDTEEGP